MKIALLEDDPDQALGLIDILRKDHHECLHFTSGHACLFSLLHESYDLAILDWQVPDLSGIEVISALRRQLAWHLPVLFLTQRDAEHDIIEALNAGADDYLTKPARSGELQARLLALTRRSRPHEGQPEHRIVCGPFIIDPLARTISVSGENMTITEKDFELALFMFQNRGRLLSRELLLERVWGVSSDLNTRTVDTHVSRLRRRLGIKPENGFRIKTVYQHGYRLEQIESTLTSPSAS